MKQPRPRHAPEPRTAAQHERISQTLARVQPDSQYASRTLWIYFTVCGGNHRGRAESAHKLVSIISHPPRDVAYMQSRATTVWGMQLSGVCVQDRESAKVSARVTISMQMTQNNNDLSNSNCWLGLLVELAAADRVGVLSSATNRLYPAGSEAEWRVCGFFHISPAAANFYSSPPRRKKAQAAYVALIFLMEVTRRVFHHS